VIVLHVSIMIQFHTKYRPGGHTFVYLLIKYCWWILGLAAGSGYFAFAVYAGILHAPMTQFLAAHADWYITTSLLAEWAALFSFGILVIAYARVSVQYRRYTFYVDDHAFHLNRGLFRVQEITIPYKQISNVHIEQPYHWRLLGLAQLDITISSSREAFRTRKRRDFLIPCIDKELARSLSHFLIKEASGDDDDDDDDYENDDEDYEDEEDGEDTEITENK
jgi:uncharacterized membrane protein YdbT with pleckstrin-like domain